MPSNNSKKKDSPHPPSKLGRPKSAVPARTLKPLRGIVWIDKEGIRTVPIAEVSPERVGWKAFGLSSLPSEWVPRFLVVDATCVKETHLEQALHEHLTQGLAEIGFQGPLVMVRSNGTKETLKHRGRLVSDKCVAAETLTTIRRLMEQQSEDAEGDVHWIVEEYVEPKMLGHLSNERHLSREQRDWVLEVEHHQQQRGYITSIAVRHWRDGSRVTDYDLSCKSEPGISLCLKRVAMWATHMDVRVHFEWIWNGNAVRIVQIDAAEAVAGVNPHSVLPVQVPDIPPDSLAVFKVATPDHYRRYGKLRNAKLYRELGYQMPAFYVLDDPEAMARILTRRDACELRARSC